MATGRRIGVIFAELGLDSTEYDKSAQKILIKTQEVSRSIETNFKELGGHSDAIFMAMRQNIINSLEMIKGSAKSSAEERVRAEQLAAEKIAAINKQQFGEQTSFLGKLKENWIAVSAAVYGAQQLMAKGMDYMREGAKAMQVESSFKILADEAGYSSKNIIESMKAATKETVDDSDLMQKANKMMLAGYNPEQIERFSKVAITASQYMGTTVSEAYDRISDALASRMPKAMVQAGAVTREQMKLVTAAIAAGVDQSVLFELAMANLELKAARLQGTMDEATLAIQRHDAAVKEMKETIGKGLIIVFEALYGVLQLVGSGIDALNYAFSKFMEGQIRARAWFMSFIPGMKADVIEMRAQAALWGKDAEAFKKSMEARDKAGREKLGLGGDAEQQKRATDAEIAARQKKVDDLVGGLQKYSKAAQQAAKAAEKDLENQRKALDVQVAMQKSTDAVLLAQMENQHKLGLMSDQEYYREKLSLIEENKNKELSYLDEQVKFIDATYEAKKKAARSSEELSQAASQHTLQLMEMELKKKQITDQAIIASDNLKTQEILRNRALEQNAAHAAYDLQDKDITHNAEMIKISMDAQADTAKYLFGKMEISETQFYEGEIERIKKVLAVEIDVLQKRQRVYEIFMAWEMSRAVGNDLEYQKLQQESIAHEKATNDAIQVLRAKASNEIVKTKRDEVDTIYKNWIGFQTNWATEMRTLSRTLWSDLTSSFSSSFYDIIVGKWEDLGEVWKNFCDQMLKAFLDALARMLTQWIAEQVIFGRGFNIPFSFGSLAGPAASLGAGALSTGSLVTGLEGISSLGLLEQGAQAIGLMGGTVSGGGGAVAGVGALAGIGGASELVPLGGIGGSTLSVELVGIAPEAAATLGGESALGGLGGLSMAGMAPWLSLALPLGLAAFSPGVFSPFSHQRQLTPEEGFGVGIRNLQTEKGQPGSFDAKQLRDTMGGLEADGKKLGLTLQQVMDAATDALGPARKGEIDLAAAAVHTNVVLSDAERAYSGQKDAIAVYTDSISTLQSILANTTDPISMLIQSIKESDASALSAENSIKFLSDSLQLSKDETDYLTKAFDKANEITGKVEDSSKATTDAIDALSKMLGIGTDMAKALAEALDLIPEEVSTTYSLNVENGAATVNPGNFSIPNGPQTVNPGNYTTPTPGTGPSLEMPPAAYGHDGGIIMHEGGMVPPWYSNLKPNERRIIGKVGEGVVNERGMALLDQINSGDLGRVNNSRPPDMHIYLDGARIAGFVKGIADGVVVDRNQRGTDPSQRVY